MTRVFNRLFPLIWAIAACGGGQGSATSPAKPTQPTPPPSNEVLPPESIALRNSAQFEAFVAGDTFTVSTDGNDPQLASPPDAGDRASFSYDGTSQAWSVELPHFMAGRVVTQGLNGTLGQVATSTSNSVTRGNEPALQPVILTLVVPGSSFSPFTYSGLGSWYGDIGAPTGARKERGEGYLVYGVPADPVQVPHTDTLIYPVQISGSTGTPSGDWFVSGNGELHLDLTAGTLTGWLSAGVFDNFDGYVNDFGRYDLIESQFNPATNRFSGKLTPQNCPTPCNAIGYLDGALAGPAAQEVILRFALPNGAPDYSSVAYAVAQGSR